MSQGQISNPLKVSSKTEAQDSSFNYLELLCKNTDDINKPNEVNNDALYNIDVSVDGHLYTAQLSQAIIMRQ